MSGSQDKCYPCSIGNIEICPHNEDGHCNLFDKECDNIQET